MQLSDYQLPTVEMLTQGAASFGEDEAEIRRRRDIINQTLRDFDIAGEVAGSLTGPRVTRFEITIEPDVNVKKVELIADNIMMNLGATGVRVLAPIPGRPVVGVEVANTQREEVFIRSVLESEAWKYSRADIPVVVGADVGGKPVVIDLAKAPHMLIAGSTGTGKAVAMNTLIASLLFKFRPDELKLLLVDLKGIEFNYCCDLPHLVSPILNDCAKTAAALGQVAKEVDRRYVLLAKHHCKHVRDFNNQAEGRPPLPYIVVVIDDLGDIMCSDFVGKLSIENAITYIAQRGQAAGIHIVVATQRPSENVITGVIKANLPMRFCFKVQTSSASCVVLDSDGAEKLLGWGDMLMMSPYSLVIERVQGAYSPDDDLRKIVEFVSRQAKPEFDPALCESSAASDRTPDAEALPKAFFDAAAKFVQNGDYELLRQAIAVSVLERKSSAEFLRCRLNIDSDRAEKLLETMHKLFMPKK